MLLAIYAGALVFGGIFVAASVLGFDKSHEADHDHSGPEVHDHVGDVGEAGALLATFLSLRFWTFALASFGLTGTLMTLLLKMQPWLSLPVSLAAGFGIGVSVASAFRLANKRQVGTIADVNTLLGREGIVLLAVEPGKAGKIRVTHDGQSLDLLARTRDPRRFERGERVLVVDMQAGEATITSPDPAHSV